MQEPRKKVQRFIGRRESSFKEIRFQGMEIVNQKNILPTNRPMLPLLRWVTDKNISF